MTWRAKLSTSSAGASLVLGAALIVVGACSRPAPPSNSVPISFGEISAAASHTPLYVAVEEGLFRKAGLDVSIQKLTGGTPSAMAAMATGSVNILMAGSTEFIEYSARKVISGKVIGELQDSTFDIVSLKGITRLQQLKGKTLGISGLNGGDQIYLEAVLERSGISPRDVALLTSGNSTNRLTALSSGAVHAIAVSNSIRETSEKTGSILLKSGDSPVQIPNSMIFAHSDLLVKNKSLLQTFLKVLGEATAWVRANPAAAAVHCAKGSGASEEACLSAFKSLSDPALAGKYTWSSTYAINTAGMEAALAAEKDRTPETRGLKLDDLIDTSIAGAVP